VEKDNEEQVWIFMQNTWPFEKKGKRWAHLGTNIGKGKIKGENDRKA